MTPAAGTWLGYFNFDPLVFELSAGESGLSGTGCIGGPPWNDEPWLCAPLTMLADRGRSVDFTWDLTKGFGPGSGPDNPVTELRLTLSPDGSAMAGSYWTWSRDTPPRESNRLDAVLVRHGAEPASVETECSGGEPSGECFEHPLRADYVRSDHFGLVELGDGELLLTWLNQRADEYRVAVARFDAANAAWGEPTFIDDDDAQDELPVFSVNGRGEALFVLQDEGALVTKHYEVATDVWSEHEVAVAAAPSTTLSARFVFLGDGGDATLVGIARRSDGAESLFVTEYAAATRAWKEPLLLDDWIAFWTAAASDAAGNAIIVWMRPATGAEVPHELWVRRRSPSGAWSESEMLHSSTTQILRPAVAIGENGEIFVTWEEWRTRIASSSSSVGANVWTQPVTVTAEMFAENRRVAQTEDGRVLAYFYRDDLRAHEVSALEAGAWNAPEPALEADAMGVNYSVVASRDTIDVTRVDSAESVAVPALERPTCEGY